MSGISRRDVIAVGGITVFFALAGLGFVQEENPAARRASSGTLPGSLATEPMLDAWIRVEPSGLITIFSGKVELGQGIRTALLQLAAEELDVSPNVITLFTADTRQTPDEGITSGSHSIQQSGTAIANAAANVRYRLREAAAVHWKISVEEVTTRAGRAWAPGGGNIGYGELVASLDLHVVANPHIPLKAPSEYRFIGNSMQRTDLPAKLSGGIAYVHDISFPGMLHARVVRGPCHGTELVKPDVTGIAREMRLDVVQDGNFIALIGEHEWPAERALQQLMDAEWRRKGPSPSAGDISRIQTSPSRLKTVLERKELVTGSRLRRLEARYTRPYLMHGAIGPSCAVALYDGTTMTVWTHSQGVFPLRRSLASLLGIQVERVHCVHVEGAGCFGHNGADDAAADAALVAKLRPGRPVRLLWAREQEHGWEPLGPAMIAELSATLDHEGRIVDWTHDTWSGTHSTRPVTGGDLVAGSELVPPLAPSPAFEIPQPEGGGDRNIVPLYNFPNAKLVSHFLPDTPVRVSALRALGAHLNVFAIESFMDELSSAAGQDAVEFRLMHLDDPRAREVIEDAASRLGWGRERQGVSLGLGFARYKNSGAYCAVALEVELDKQTLNFTVHRVTASIDCGQVVNPDGVRNQVEGGIIQSLSWTKQEVVTFDAERRNTSSWSDYPISRFADVPREIDVNILERPGSPFLGTGEAAQGPAAAALANAVSVALGFRVRDMPFSSENLRKARNGAPSRR